MHLYSKNVHRYIGVVLNLAALSHALHTLKMTSCMLACMLYTMLNTLLMHTNNHKVKMCTIHNKALVLQCSTVQI